MSPSDDKKRCTVEIGRRGRLILGVAFALAAQAHSPHAAAGQSGGDRPKDYAAWEKRGETLRDEGKYAEAAAAFREAAALPSKDYRAETALAQISVELGNWSQAVAFYRRARRKAPLDYGLCVNLAITYDKMGEIGLAKELYAEAKRINPKQSAAYIQEGYDNLRDGNYAQAKEEFQSAIAVDTSSPDGYHHMATYFSERGDWAAAERSLRKALELLNEQPRPSAPRKHLYDVLHAMYNLASVLDHQGRFDEEAALYRRMLTMLPEVSEWQEMTFDRMAMLYAHQGQRAQAEEYFKRAAALCRPELSRSYRVLCVYSLVHQATLYADEAFAARAREAADKAWNLSPDADRWLDRDFGSIMVIGALYSRLGDAAKAEKVYRLIISQRSRLFQSEMLSGAETELAAICGKTGRDEEASELYRDAIRIARLRGERKEEIRLRLQLARMGTRPRPSPSAQRAAE